MIRDSTVRSLSAPAALVLLAASLVSASRADEPDAAGCKDHPLFTRMQGMRLVTCRMVDFDRFDFRAGKGVTTPVEGRRFEIKYQMPPGGVAPSPLAILRNHEVAIGTIGGAVVHEDQRYATLKLAKDGAEIWAQVDTAWGRGYQLIIVEKRGMVQEVKASAELFKAGLAASGHVEVPGIYFDTGKAELKAESDAALAEVARLLEADPALRLYVVGHTDNVADLDLNTRLSQARAEAVAKALVGKHGISAARLVGRGVGPLAPVASNDSEAGRAKNRRVELVKR